MPAESADVTLHIHLDPVCIIGIHSIVSLLLAGGNHPFQRMGAGLAMVILPRLPPAPPTSLLFSSTCTCSKSIINHLYDYKSGCFGSAASKSLTRTYCRGSKDISLDTQYRRARLCNLPTTSQYTSTFTALKGTANGTPCCEKVSCCRLVKISLFVPTEYVAYLTCLLPHPHTNIVQSSSGLFRNPEHGPASPIEV